MYFRRDDSFPKHILSRTTGSNISLFPISMSIRGDQYHVRKTDHLGWGREAAPVEERKTASKGCCCKLQPQSAGCHVPPSQLDAASAEHLSFINIPVNLADTLGVQFFAGLMVQEQMKCVYWLHASPCLITIALITCLETSDL